MINRIVKALLKALCKGNADNHFFAPDEALNQEMAWHFRAASHDYQHDPDHPPMYYEPFNDMYL